MASFITQGGEGGASSIEELIMFLVGYFLFVPVVNVIVFPLLKM